jgi:nicotinamidase-related amidase
MSKKEELLRHCGILINGLQELSVSTTFTQQYTKGLGETIPEIRSLVSNFSYIDKTDFSCLDESAYAEWLRQQNRKNVIICGIEAHVCVLQTAIDLKEKGYNPIVVVDCISSRTEENKALSLERLKQEKIILSSYESILFELTRSAKAPEFRTISKLIK